MLLPNRARRTEPQWHFVWREPEERVDNNGCGDIVVVWQLFRRHTDGSTAAEGHFVEDIGSKLDSIDI